MSIPPPPIRDALTATSWVMWFQAVYQALRVPAAGTTAQRPTVALFVGQSYFDTDLVKPIWWDGAAWRTADGGAA